MLPCCKKTKNGAVAILECDISSVSIGDSLVYSTNYPEESFLSQLCFSCFRPGPSSFSYVARQMGHHGAWQEALQLLSLLQDNDQGVKFEVWCSVMWAMDVSLSALHFFLVEGFELLSRLFFFPTEDHTQPNGPFFYFLDNGGEVDSYTP